MEMQHGNLSINSENIFPIIKKWMYSDQDIFVRELISNACDAITKRKKLDAVGEAQLPDDYRPAIHVIVDDAAKTLTVVDNGIGMTADEVKKNITDIAFSGATEFLEKYKDKTDDDQIIGHFGLGFYSAFMVADEVDIDTRSFTEGAQGVHWTCDGSTEYEMGDGDWEEVGTMVTLHLNEDCLEYANEYKVREVLDKYCAFMPYEIFLEKAGAEPEKDEDGNEKEPKPVNDIHPLWAKQPNDCTDEEYKEFYRHVFYDYKEPLFWIHLNMDYPFNLRGILYFPRINSEYESIEGKIKLYNNQVFIADNIKEVIPEYLLLLKGVIDCPDLPLNVSRSALQNDGFVQKISDYISKKVADKLSGLCKTDRENYEKYWDDISPFIKFGCIRDEKFAERMADYILYKDLDDNYLTLKDLKKDLPDEADGADAGAKDEPADDAPEVIDADGETIDAEAMEPEKQVIYYVTDPVQQSQYINLFKAQGMQAVILRHNIDAAFISHMERVDEQIRFQRIDADVTDELRGEADVPEKLEEKLQKQFRKELDNKELKVKVETLKDTSVASMITLSEEGRRMSEMMRMYGYGGGDLPGGDVTLILNASHPLVNWLAEHPRSKNAGLICAQLYDLAMLANRPLAPEEMTRFVARSNELLEKLMK